MLRECLGLESNWLAHWHTGVKVVMNVKWVTVFLLLQLAVAIGSNTCGGSAATVVLNDSGFNAGAITFGVGVIAGADTTTLARQGAISSDVGGFGASQHFFTFFVFVGLRISIAISKPVGCIAGSVASQSQRTYSRNRAQPRFTPL